MHTIGPLRRAHGLLGAASLVWLAATGSPAQTTDSYALPLAKATEWQVFVFGARVPDALAEEPVPFTVEAAWQVNDETASRRLTGTATRFRTTQLSLNVPAGCSSLLVSLDWQAPGVDLDIGLSCSSLGLRLAPLFTVLKPERVRLDAQTAPFYRWLASEHPDWWKGYPFWAEIRPAPTRDVPKEPG